MAVSVSPNMQKALLCNPDAEFQLEDFTGYLSSCKPRHQRDLFPSFPATMSMQPRVHRAGEFVHK